jgi:hypothetical protein
MWSAWNRYENPVWQRNSRDWLHHAAHVGNAAFEGTTEALIRLFLEVFWWWDAYVPTEYSRDLLADYRALLDTRGALGRGSADDGGWLRRLEDFQANYVPGWGQEPGEHADRWKKVDRALRALWRSCHLGTEPMPDAARNLRRIQILVCAFRGDARRYGSTAGAEAAAGWYQAASAACVTEDEEWIANWADFLRADLLQGTDPEAAAELLAGLPARVGDVGDHELRVDVARLFADLAWLRGDPALALDIHARALLHAYVYQVRQELERQAPHAYSAALYHEMRTRAERRLAEAADGGHADVVATATVRMRAFFEPYWAERGEEPDNPSGFPPGPGADDLNALDTDYSDLVECMIDDMADQLEEPLDAPLKIA